MKALADHVAVVTGAGAGIGRAIAGRLAAEGAAVVVADLDFATGWETVQYIKTAGGVAAFFRADVAVAADVQGMTAFAQEQLGGLDILVNNAGIAPWPPFPESGPAVWGRALDVNLRGTMLGIQCALEPMRRRGGGVIVNIASMAGAGYRSYDAPEYAATKAGIMRLTSALGSLRATAGIRVNCICPGWVETETVKRNLAALTAEQRAAASYPPPALLIQPEQIADLVVMFVLNEQLAGRVLVWPDGEPWRLIPLDATV